MSTTFPSGGLPSSGAPGPVNWNDPEAGSMGNGGWLDQLMALVAYRDKISDDPTAELNLLISVINCPPADQAQMNAFFQTSQGNAMLDDIPSAITKLADNAYFRGYGGLTGEAAYNQWCSDALKSLPAGSSNPYVAAVQAALQATGNPTRANEFAALHPNGTWTQLLPDGTSVTWTWNQNEGGENRYQIEQMIDNNGTMDTEWDTNLSSLRRNYRLEALQANLKEFKNNPFLMIMWLQTVFGNEYESDESGEADVNNTLNDTSTNYSSPLITDAQGIGSMSGADAQTFVTTLNNLTNIVNTSSKLSSIASDYNTNCFNQLMHTPITRVSMYTGGNWVTGTVTSSPPPTLGQIMNGGTVTNVTLTPDGGGKPITIPTYTFGVNTAPVGQSELSQDLNLQNPAPSGNPDNTTTTPAYQTITSIVQQIGALFTNQSKTVSTMVSKTTNLESQIVKLGKTTVTSWQQFVNAMLNAQTSKGG